MATTNDGQAIRAERVSRHYKIGETVIRAVDDVTLAVARGEFVALLGASGSGKSTLLNLLAGLDRPTSGEIWVESRELGAMSSLDLARYRSRTVGMVFQAFNLLPRMTLEENVELPLLYKSGEMPDSAALARRMLAAVGLGGREQSLPSQLSGGQQQRVAIARALINRPEILLADEPTGQLDTHTGAEIMEIFVRLHRERGLTILLVTHADEIAAYAGRIIGFRDGRVVSDAPTGAREPGARGVRAGPAAAEARR